MKATEVIPDITDPLGRHWEQPARQDIEICDDFAFMTEDSFKALLTYSSTSPTGVYDGKMWKCECAPLKPGGKPRFLLRWYAPDQKPDYCVILHKRIVVVGTDTFRKLFR